MLKSQNGLLSGYSFTGY